MSDSVIMFIGQIFNGLKIGSVYSLVALGYTMVYGIIRLINFAHGDFIMVGSYALMLTIPFIIACGLPAWFAVIPAVLVCVAVGIIVERAAYKPVREKGNNMTALITAIAMSLLLENGSQALFGADYQTVPTIVEIPTLVLGKLKIDGATIITVLLGIAIMVALQLFVSLTKQGKAMRAVSEDKEASILMGINVNSTITLTFAIGSGLAAVAALMYCISYPQVSPMMGAMLGLKAFVAAVLGGIGSIPGAMSYQGVYRYDYGRCDHVGVLRRHCVRHSHHRAAGQAVRSDGRAGKREGVIMKKSMLSTKQSYALCAIGVLVLFGILVAVCETGAISLYVKGILMTCCIAVIMTTSLNLTIGVLGQLTLGCCGFEAIGAYSAALMSKLLVANGVQMDDTVRFLLVTFVGGVVACVFGVLVGIPALRLHGDYLAIITLGFGEIIRVIIQNLKVAGGKGLADGQQGQALIGIDRLANLYVVFCITVVTVVLLFMFARSRYGRAVKAIRDDEIAAGASGINITYMKVLVFAISAFFAGIAGGIFAQYIGALTPSMAGWLQSINYVIMVVFGGMGSLTGSIVAAVGLTILPELLRAFSAYRMLVYSVVLVIIMVFRPQGLFGNWEFSLPKFVNKWFYPVRVKMHGKSGASQSASKKTKETGETTASSEINTSSEDKEVQA